MKPLHVLALAGVLVALGSTAIAQEKPAPAKQDAAAKPDPNVRTGESQRQLHHGDRVVLKGKGEATVVWQDTKSDKVYVRTKAGERPVAVSRNEITDVRPVAGTKNTGGIRPAVEGDPPPPSADYEIRSVQVYNGPYKTVHFFGRDLSPAERAQLNDLEKAANRVADDEELVENLENAIQRPSIPTSQEVNVVPTPAATPYPYGMPGVYPYSYFAPYYPYYYYPISYYNNYYFNYYPPLAFFPPMMPQTSPTIIVQNSGGGANDGGASRTDLAKALQAAQDRLRKDRESYAQASSRAVYDPSGRIVAVRFEE